MIALLDGDILRYEIGFAAEAGWRHATGRDEVPPWSYVQDLLHQRLEQITYEAGASSYQLYLTGEKSFRFDIAKSRPYKGQRVENKPWHYDNLTAYLIGVLDARVTENDLEADDAMAIESCSNPGRSIVVSRDKDLRQVPGRFYSWELGNQPSYGPTTIDVQGSLSLDTEGKTPKLSGTGFAWWCAQVLMGDRVDNIPGLPGWGPVSTYSLLAPLNTPEEMYEEVERVYKDGDRLPCDWEEYLLEQGRLCWLIRRMNEDGSPQLWSLGQYE